MRHDIQRKWRCRLAQCRHLSLSNSRWRPTGVRQASISNCLVILVTSSVCSFQIIGLRTYIWGEFNKASVCGKHVARVTISVEQCHNNSTHLIPAYKQKLKQEVPVTRSIRKRSDDADATLQDCFASTDWNMFRDSSNDIEEYTTSVIGFINKCIWGVTVWGCGQVSLILITSSNRCH